MYNYYQPQATQYQPQPQQQRMNFLKGRPVSSMEEVRASAIDFDGSIFYFPDLANNRIYTKQINIDGTASLCMYELKSSSPELTTDYVTRDEFKNTVNHIEEMLASFVPKEEEKKSDFKANF